VFANVQQFLILASYSPKSLSRKNCDFFAEVYTTQQTYWNAFDRSFPEVSSGERKKLNGWREFFYGNRESARFYWQKELNSIKVLLAYILTFLPEGWFGRLKEFRLLQRLNYRITYLSVENRKVRSSLKKMLS
jgi:hypothetical protein